MEVSRWVGHVPCRDCQKKCKVVAFWLYSSAAEWWRAINSVKTSGLLPACNTANHSRRRAKQKKTKTVLLRRKLFSINIVLWVLMSQLNVPVCVYDVRNELVFLFLPVSTGLYFNDLCDQNTFLYPRLFIVGWKVDKSNQKHRTCDFSWKIFAF